VSTGGCGRVRGFNDPRAVNINLPLDFLYQQE
jgi:hypothetical protein